MSQDEIKAIIKTYRTRAMLVLASFMLIAIFANWYYVKNNIERHAELGLTYASTDMGLIWISIIVGLLAVLLICFHYFEKVLCKLFAKHN